MVAVDFAVCVTPEMYVWMGCAKRTIALLTAPIRNVERTIAAACVVRANQVGFVRVGHAPTHVFLIVETRSAVRMVAVVLAVTVSPVIHVRWRMASALRVVPLSV
jgi:hypothetical protein